MSRIRILYAFEAALCGGPVTVAAVYGFPWLVIGPLMVFGQSPITAAKSLLWLAGCMCALGAFWHLVISTVTNRRHRFEVFSWLGVVGAVFALAEVAKWSDSWATLAFFFAPAVCAAHFIYLQRQRISQ